MFRLSYNLSKHAPNVYKREYETLHHSTRVKGKVTDRDGEEHDYELFIVPINQSEEPMRFTSYYREAYVTYSGPYGVDTKICKSTVEFTDALYEWNLTTQYPSTIFFYENPEEEDLWENEHALAERKLFDDILTSAIRDGVVIKEFSNEFGYIKFSESGREIDAYVVTSRTDRNPKWKTEMHAGYTVEEYRNSYPVMIRFTQYDELKKFFRGLRGEISHFLYYEAYDLYYCLDSESFVENSVPDAIPDDDKTVVVKKGETVNCDNTLDAYKAVKQVNGELDKTELMKNATMFHRAIKGYSFECEKYDEYRDAFIKLQEKSQGWLDEEEDEDEATD